jgi:hypothetical protein
MINIIIFVLIFISIITFLVYHYWTHNYHSKSKFQTFLIYIYTIATIILSLAIIFSILNYNDTKKEENVTNYTNISNKFFTEVIKQFMDTDDIDYFYDEIMDIKKIDKNTKRNITKEHQICMFIFSKLAIFLIYVLETNDIKHSEKLNQWITHVMNTYMKSEIFRNYWIYEYKPKLSGYATRQYMAKTYGL